MKQGIARWNRPNIHNDGILREPAKKYIARWKNEKHWIQRWVRSRTYLEDGFPFFPIIG